MEEELNTILITFDDDTEAEFFVLEETQLMGVNYYLVVAVDSEDEEEAECYILKEHANPEEKEYGSYEFVEDDAELEAVGTIFRELLEDSDTEVEF